jgi:hypothetical protein
MKGVEIDASLHRISPLSKRGNRKVRFQIWLTDTKTAKQRIDGNVKIWAYATTGAQVVNMLAIRG